MSSYLSICHQPSPGLGRKLALLLSELSGPFCTAQSTPCLEHPVLGRNEVQDALGPVVAVGWAGLSPWPGHCLRFFGPVPAAVPELAWPQGTHCSHLPPAWLLAPCDLGGSPHLPRALILAQAWKELAGLGLGGQSQRQPDPRALQTRATATQAPLVGPALSASPTRAGDRGPESRKSPTETPGGSGRAQPSLRLGKACHARAFTPTRAHTCEHTDAGTHVLGVHTHTRTGVPGQSQASATYNTCEGGDKCVARVPRVSCARSHSSMCPNACG